MPPDAPRPEAEVSGGLWIGPDARVAYFAGLLLTAVPVVTYALAQSGLLAGIPISRAHLPLSLGAALVLMGVSAVRVSGPACLREGTVAMLLAVALAVGSATMAAGFYDLSSDGKDTTKRRFSNWRTDGIRTGG